MKLKQVTEFIDDLRIFPRVFITVYIYIFYEVIQWFMALQEPNMAQSGFVSVVVGAGAAWFGLYVNSGKGKNVNIQQYTDNQSDSSRSRSRTRSRTTYDPEIDGPVG